MLDSNNGPTAQRSQLIKYSERLPCPYQKSCYALSRAQAARDETCTRKVGCIGYLIYFGADEIRTTYCTAVSEIYLGGGWGIGDVVEL